jgi:hypothetical protein
MIKDGTLFGGFLRSLLQLQLISNVSGIVGLEVHMGHAEVQVVLLTVSAACLDRLYNPGHFLLLLLRPKQGGAFKYLKLFLPHFYVIYAFFDIENFL